jgi:essential nuclear protein 1
VKRAALDPKIVAVYGQIGALLRSYRSGRLPKAMKILPMIENWEELLFLTRPEDWTPHAAGALTKIYASNFTEKMAQRFYVLVLLPLVRADIARHKKLNFHLYMALKKALYKPAAWYKGILLPLAEAGDCTLVEAHIVASVLRRVSVPALPSAVALLQLARMPYNGSISYFVRALIDKRYALPYRVVDALVAHFARFRAEERPLPVAWHQSLLAFAQRYKEDVTAEQKAELKLLFRDKPHHAITPEIRREFFSTKNREDHLVGAPELRRMQALVELDADNDEEDDDAMDIGRSLKQ